MERKLKKFVPAFLQKIDRDWMLNRPYLWATKIHYVLFYGLIGLGLSMTFGQLQPISPSQISISTSFLIMLSIPAVLALGYWWYRLSITFSHYAHDVNIWRRNFGLILIGSLLIMSVPVSGWFIMEWRSMEVRSSLNRLQDTKTLARGVQLFDSVLPNQLYTTYRKGKPAERSWLYSYTEEEAEHDFLSMNQAFIARDFIKMAHRYLPESYPISTEKLIEAYLQNKFPPNFTQDALWQWRQDLVEKLNYWEDMGVLNPFNLYYYQSQPSIKGMNWKIIYPGILLFLIPFLGLGISLIYLGFRGFIGFVLSLTALGILIGTLGQFMTYRVELNESFYGMIALMGFFSLYYGFSKMSQKNWHRSVQKVSLFVGLTALYGLMILGPSVLFSLHTDGPPSPLLLAGILTMISALWLGPFQKRINDLQTTPSAF